MCRRPQFLLHGSSHGATGMSSLYHSCLSVERVIWEIETERAIMSHYLASEVTTSLLLCSVDRTCWLDIICEGITQGHEYLEPRIIQRHLGNLLPKALSCFCPLEKVETLTDSCFFYNTASTIKCMLSAYFVYLANTLLHVTRRIFFPSLVKCV